MRGIAILSGSMNAFFRTDDERMNERWSYRVCMGMAGMTMGKYLEDSALCRTISRFILWVSVLVWCRTEGGCRTGSFTTSKTSFRYVSNSSRTAQADTDFLLGMLLRLRTMLATRVL